MRLRMIAAAFGLAAVAALSACGGEGKLGIEDVPGADALAASTLQTTIQNMGYNDVEVEPSYQDGPGADTSVKVLSAKVGHPNLQECRLNIEQKYGTTESPYFDAVITPAKPEGIEVPEATRSTLQPLEALAYVATALPECKVTNASPGVATPTP